MKDEYISRAAASAYAPLPKGLREYETGNLDDAFEYGYDFAIKQIEAIPAADVAPVVPGKWLRSSDNGPEWIICNKCGCPHKNAIPVPPNFCPNCGADMRTGDKPCKED